MKKCLTIEDLKNRVGKPVFIASPIYLETTKWNVIKEIAARQDLLYKYLEFIDGLTITFENVNDFRFFDTEVSATELKEILESEEKEKKKTGYEIVDEGGTYFYISNDLCKEKERYTTNDRGDLDRATHGNHFNDEKLCENIARAERLKYQLRRYAALNGGIPSQADWENSHVAKYEIIGESDNFIHATKNFESRAIGAVYFKDINACEKAMVIFKDELIWYFTEFEEMLY